MQQVLICLPQIFNNLNKVKHVYNDHAYIKMTFITKPLGNPGKPSIFFFYEFYANSEVAYNEITLITK